MRNARRTEFWRRAQRSTRQGAALWRIDPTRLARCVCATHNPPPPPPPPRRRRRQPLLPSFFSHSASPVSFHDVCEPVFFFLFFLLVAFILARSCRARCELRIKRNPTTLALECSDGEIRKIIIYPMIERSSAVGGGGNVGHMLPELGGELGGSGACFSRLSNTN